MKVVNMISSMYFESPLHEEMRKEVSVWKEQVYEVDWDSEKHLELRLTGTKQLLSAYPKGTEITKYEYDVSKGKLVLHLMIPYENDRQH